jgi:D-alanyl-D-alanine carboxypeptidase/D-alanyl-D-alanine-endopeptidase (penicillin-binding protein 4)
LPAKINIYPDTKYVSVTNTSSTVKDTINFKKLKIERDWRGQTNHFNITGEILEWSEKDTIKKNIFEPQLFAGTVFKELLESHGVSINILHTADNLHFQDTIAVHYSEPLFTQLDDMMHKSENLTSELLMKFIGISDTTNGSWQSGIHKVRTFLFDEANIDTSSLRIADGSGLSRYNLLSTDQIVRLLAYMYDTEYKDNFLMTLPHGGEKDTRLEERLIESQEKIYAKTGSISGVTCLSGYAFSPRYGPLTFSIMINGFVGSLTPYRQFQDEICNWLVRS